ncbi:MAG: FprA family A-type flavoprotein [Verrucomicrobia bacterium]|nr:FprA family A-type flavoprotein [Verrucomicrobiota bacterium]MBU1910736.1 FprA family A-type flavoprotein [Verrucomicrobiota bacterium]
MTMRKIVEGVHWCGVVDWDRRMFDALVPLPDGTSYNAYLVQGSEQTALLDGVDDSKTGLLLETLRDVPKIDYIISHHAEQDHSGALPALMQRYPEARLLASVPGRKFLLDLLELPEDRVVAVKDGETLALGGKTLRFLSTPWVHWPETMSTFLEEDGILFSCDFFGSHLATSELYAKEGARVYRAAKLYYAQIMLPYAKQVAKNIEKVAALDIRCIAPSHGPLYDKPSIVMDAWREWTSAPPQNLAVVAYVSMHGSTRRMAEHLVNALIARGVSVRQFDLTSTDLGELAMTLVDASTILLGTPAMLNGVHPLAANAAFVINALHPKAKFAGLFGSYGWGAKPLENPAALFPGLALEFLPPVLSRGLPRAAEFTALDQLAAAVAAKHAAPAD